MAGKNNIQRKWVLQAQEEMGTYQFSGNMFVTKTVVDSVPPDEIYLMIADVKERVKSNKGADYLQVFKEKYGDRTIYFIDNLNQEMINNSTPEFVKENNYYTILFSFEY